LRQGFGRGASGLVNEYTGANLGAKDAQSVVDSAAAIGEARQLQDLVRKTPGLVGREGQVRQFVDRYVNSLMSDKPVPSDAESGIDDQQALRFAKRYASYLVNYERSLAPGARGFTVAFQNRFNNLMKQDQFNAQGMVQLLNDQQEEVAKQATRIDRSINRNNLQQIGDDIVGRAVETPQAAPQQQPSTAQPKKYDSADAVKQAYKNGQISKDQAKDILVKEFGMK
jgi:hypothetical protein